jgi:hypothetical protein
LTLSGQPITNPITSEVTTFMATGDPVAGTGWLDELGPDDHRLTATTAADSVAPGDTVELVFSVTIARGSDNLNSITALRAAAAAARTFWENGFAGVTAVDRPILAGEVFVPDMIFEPVEPGPPYNMIDLVLLNNGNQFLSGTAEFPAGSPFQVEFGAVGIPPGGSQTLTVIFYASAMTATTLQVPGGYATIQEAIDAAQLHAFFDSIDVSSNDPYAAQEDNGLVGGSIFFEGDTITVAAGTYVENLLIEGRMVHLMSTDGTAETIIDGVQGGSCVTFRNAPGASIRGFTIENGSEFRGGGINAEYSYVSIEDNLIRNNHATHGGGLSTYSISGSITRNLIINNDADGYGGGARMRGSDVVFANNTVWGNSAVSGAAGAYIASSAYPVINSIIWGNGDDTLQVYGDAEIVYSTLSSSWPGEGNLVGDPLFVDPDGGNFQLQEESPSIDAGTARFVWGEDELINLPPEEYAGWAPDMGAIESPYASEICALPGLWVGYFNSWMEDTVMVFEWPGVFEGQAGSAPDGNYQWRDCWYFTDSNLVAFGYYLPDAGETEPAEWTWGTYEIAGDSIVFSGFGGGYEFWNVSLGFTFEIVYDFPDNTDYRYTGCSISLSGPSWNSTFTWYLLPMDTEGLKADVIALEPPIPLPVSVEGGYLALPLHYALHQNYPNPFNPVSTIRYDLPQADEVSLIVHDILGREVVRLVDGHIEPGYHHAQWDGRDRRGRSVPSGIYIARIVTSQYTKSIKMVMLK